MDSLNLNTVPFRLVTTKVSSLPLLDETCYFFSTFFKLKTFTIALPSIHAAPYPGTSAMRFVAQAPALQWTFIHLYEQWMMLPKFPLQNRSIADWLSNITEVFGMQIETCKKVRPCSLSDDMATPSVHPTVQSLCSTCSLWLVQPLAWCPFHGMQST